MKTPTQKLLKMSLLIASILLFAIILLDTLFITHTKSFSESTDRLSDFLHKNEPGSQIALLTGDLFEVWEIHGFGKWSMKDDILSVTNGPGYLATHNNEIQDFILSLKVKTSRKGNSGIFFRAKDADTLWPWPIGYEAQVDQHDPLNPTGSLYNRASAPTGLTQDNEWFQMKIRAIGPSIQIFVNDALVVDATDHSYQKGYIALQAHDLWSRIEYREMILQIPAED